MVAFLSTISGATTKSATYSIIEANRIDFHVLKMRISFSAIEKIQCSKF